MGVTVYFVAGSTTPALSITTSTTDAFVKPGEATTLRSVVSNPSSFVASAAFLDVGDAWSTVHSTTHALWDGTTANLTANAQGGRDVLLGNIPRGYWRAVDWTVSWPWEGIWPWATTARGDNFAGVADHGTQVTVDGTPPSAPVPGSTSHAPGSWSNWALVQFAWPTPPDNLAGVEGYSASISLGAPQDPGTVATLGSSNQWSAILLSGSTPSYFNLRAVDRCGNWSPPAWVGPFLVDVAPPPAATNVGSPLSPNTWVGGAGSAAFHGSWDPVVDPESGLYGYGVALDQSPGTEPAFVSQSAGATTLDAVVTATGAWYLHVRAFDVAGNWGPTAHAGPYLFHVAPNVTYCTAKVNALGCTPAISAVGHASVKSASNFVVSGANVRNNKPGLLLYSTNGPQANPFQGGILCLRAPVRRSTPVSSGGSPSGNDCTGVYRIDMNEFAHGLLGGSPQPELLVQGTVVRCQWWGRDPGFAAPNNSTLSDALEYFVCHL